MSDRDTENLNQSWEDDDPVTEPSLEEIRDDQNPEKKDTGDSSGLSGEPSGIPSENQKKISIHYPQPVFLNQILPEVSKWSGFNIVMDPGLNRAMQVFAPRKMGKEDAFQIFVASLETVGLRALQIDASLIKIVPGQYGQRSA